MQRHHLLKLSALAVLGATLSATPARARPEAREESPAEGRRDTAVLGRLGDRFNGTVSGISNGVLRLSSPFFDREAGIFVSTLKEVQFPSRAAEPDGDILILTNGDRICGKIEGMTAAEVSIRSSSAGALKIASRFVTQLGFGGRAGTLVHTEFNSGKTAPLQVAGSQWQLSEGVLRVGYSGQTGTATIPLDQSDAVTVAVDFARMGRRWSLAVFNDLPGRGSGERISNAVVLSLNPNGYDISVLKEGSLLKLPGTFPAGPGGAQEVRFAYDPAAGEVRLCVNGQIIADARTPPGAPKRGKYIVLTFHDHAELRSIDVLDGVATPAPADADAEHASPTVTLVSGESMHSATITLANGAFAIKPAFVEKPLLVPVEKVASIRMSKTGRELPPPPERPVQVCLARSLLTVDLIELNAKTAVARSPCLGDIRIERDAIRTLRWVRADNKTVR